MTSKVRTHISKLWIGHFGVVGRGMDAFQGPAESLREARSQWSIESPVSFGDKKEE